MCNTCVAEQALYMTSCGKEKCPSSERGFETRWEEGPSLTMEQEDPVRARRYKKFDRLLKKHRRNWKTKRAQMVNNVNRALPRVFVRARGRGAEFKPARYQVRLAADKWPRNWTETKDLAGSMALFGLDVRWKWVPKLVKEWVLRKGKKPTEAQLRSEIKKRQPKPLTEIGKQRLRKRYERQGYQLQDPKNFKMKVGWTYIFIRGTEERWAKPPKKK